MNTAKLQQIRGQRHVHVHRIGAERLRHGRQRGRDHRRIEVLHEQRAGDDHGGQSRAAGWFEAGGSKKGRESRSIGQLSVALLPRSDHRRRLPGSIPIVPMPAVCNSATALNRRDRAVPDKHSTTKHTRKIPGFCALCRARCGCLSVVENGRLVAVEPNPEHPTGAALCAKGRAAPDLVYSPDRLLYPMKRTRPKGDADPGWQRIGWDEALDIAVGALGRLRDSGGPESVAFSVTTPSATGAVGCHPLDRAADQRLQQPELVLRDRTVQLAQGLCAQIHLRRRRHRTRFRTHRVRAAVGAQSQRVLADACRGCAISQGSRRTDYRGGPASSRSRQQG